MFFFFFSWISMLFPSNAMDNIVLSFIICMYTYRGQNKIWMNGWQINTNTMLQQLNLERLRFSIQMYEMYDPPIDMCIEHNFRCFAVFFFLFSQRHVSALLVTPRRHSMLYIEYITNTFKNKTLLTVTDYGPLRVNKFHFTFFECSSFAIVQLILLLRLVVGRSL